MNIILFAETPVTIFPEPFQRHAFKSKLLNYIRCRVIVKCKCTCGGGGGILGEMIVETKFTSYKWVRSDLTYDGGSD